MDKNEPSTKERQEGQYVFQPRNDPPLCRVCEEIVEVGCAWRKGLIAIHRKCLPPPVRKRAFDGEEKSGNVNEVCSCGKIIYKKIIY